MIGKGNTIVRAFSSGASLLVVSFALAMAAGVAAQDAPWQLQKQEDNISVYTRQIDESPFLAVKATVRINAPIARVSKFLGNGDGCAEWRAMCKSSQVLEQVSEHERYLYMVLDLPWPVSDRDLVIHSTTHIDPQSSTATVDLQSVSSRYPPQDFVRAETRGQFVIKVLGPEQVEFTYIMHTDLGGDLPANMVNSRLTKSALADLKRLQRLAVD